MIESKFEVLKQAAAFTVLFATIVMAMVIISGVFNNGH